MYIFGSFNVATNIKQGWKWHCFGLESIAKMQMAGVFLLVFVVRCKPSLIYSYLLKICYLLRIGFLWLHQHIDCHNSWVYRLFNMVNVIVYYSMQQMIPASPHVTCSHPKDPQLDYITIVSYYSCMSYIVKLWDFWMRACHMGWSRNHLLHRVICSYHLPNRYILYYIASRHWLS